MIQQIPLNGGLVTQVDGEEVSIKACTELINAEFDKPGIIYKRRGGNDTVNTGKTFVSITRWYNPNIGGSYYWIGIDSSDNVWHSINLTSWTEISFDSSDALCLGGSPITEDDEIVKLVNYNTQLRFPCGLTDDARIYQYIDRDFFWSAQEGTPGFYADIARPRNTIQDFITTNKVSNNSGTFGTTNHHDLSSNNFYYRYSLVFDGISESPIGPESHIGDTTSWTNASSVPKIELGINMGASLANWNKRVTGINIYRASEFNGIYFKVASISTLSNDVNNVDVSDAVYQLGFTDPSRVFTNPQNDTELTVNSATDFLSKSLGTWEIGSSTGSLTTPSASDKIAIASVEERALVGASAFPDLWDEPYEIIRNHADSTLVHYQFSSGTEGWTAVIDSTVGSGSSTTTAVSSVSGGNSGNCLKMLTTNNDGSYDYSYGMRFISPVITLEDNAMYDFSYYTKGYTGLVWLYLYPENRPVQERRNINRKSGTSGWGEEHRYFESYYTNEIEPIPSTANVNEWRIHIYVDPTVSPGGGTFEFFLDDVKVIRKYHRVITRDSRGFGGNETIVSSSLALGDVGTKKGSLYTLQDPDDASTGIQSGYLDNSIRNAVLVDGTIGGTEQAVESGLRLTISDNYSWVKNGNTQLLTFYDKGLSPGTEHLTGETSLDVKHRHSKFINGRNYVADVRITDGTDTEDHENWVMFSELNQPDVIPISNYIQLTDAQGGKIVGIESLMGDLAVLMERGIYRLSIPSEDPTAWSLSESEENIGCLSENSITAWESGLFFAGKDHLYYLDVNFNATPITASIKDDYQSAITSSARTFYDVKKNRLLCRFGTDGGTIYSLDLSMFPEERWTKVVSGSSDMDIFTLNEDLTLYSYDNETQEIKSHIVSTSLLNEPTSFKRTTGWISQSNLDRSGVLRRLNLKYKSGDPITAKIYIDGDDTTIVSTITIPADTTGADWYKCKPNVRCRSYKVELSTTTTHNEVEIKRIEVEFE